MHKMRLHNEPFILIKKGVKTIELRLNDEKRKLIKIGDIIEFTSRATGEKLIVKVIALHYYDDFETLYKRFNKISIGYKEGEDIDPKNMDLYYSKDEQKRYGVVGIEFVLI